MESNTRDQSGQTLVQVAILMVVLMAFAALAVDGGRIYLERRRLQNAADAGALAGAFQICFRPDAMDPLAKAEQYAIQQNGAQSAMATYADADHWQVSVVATRTLDMGLADVVGFPEVVVGADAIAQCGMSSPAGELWPLTVKLEPDWEDVPCTGPDSVFAVFAQSSQDIDCRTADNLDGECDCQKAVPAEGGQAYPGNLDWAALLNDGAATRIGPGQRGWADMPVVSDPELNPGECRACGGNNSLACWLQYLHPRVAICDRIGTQAGVSWSDGVRDAVEFHTREQTEIHIPLWGDTCAQPGATSCNGNYVVRGFGCIQSLGYAMLNFYRFPPSTDRCQHGSNVKVIFAQRLCNCRSPTGGTGGVACDAEHPCSVSLIK